MWSLNGKPVQARDETRRDEKQGQVIGSAWRGVKHLIDMSDVYDQMTLGWIYTNPSDKAVADYIRQHGDAIHEKKTEFSKDKLFVYTLVHRGGKQTADQRAMLEDMRNGKQPFGTVNILTKARVDDLKDFGEDTTSESFRADIVNTIKMLREANQKVNVELALEHIYTAWLETNNQAANRQHIVDTIADYLLHTDPNSRRVITAPDTDGAHKPEEIREVLTGITKALAERGIVFDPSLFTAHMHDDLGHATANTVAALECGAGAFDSNTVAAGERRGNATAVSLTEAIQTDKADKIARYKEYMDEVLGIREGDNMLGAADAFCATGGMHAARLFHALEEEIAKGKSVANAYEHVVSHYAGSYATVPAHQFGQKLQVTLSPVAGGANVRFMLAGMGFLADKNDARIAEALNEVKDGEFNRGINYRGYNNTNAFLMLADKFGLRAGNKLGITVRYKDIYDGGFVPHFQLSLASKEGIEPFTREWGSPNRPEHFNAVRPGHAAHGMAEQEWEKCYDAQLASAITEKIKQALSEADSRFGDLQVLQARRLEAPVGMVIPKDGDVLQPQPEGVMHAAKLIFTAGTNEKFQANGVGKTYEQALSMALQTMFDFKCFQIERERKATGQSPLLDSEQMRQNQVAATARDEAGKGAFWQRYREGRLEQDGSEHKIG